MSMQMEAVKRRYEEIHEDRPFHDGTFSHWAESFSLDFPFHAKDGVLLWMAPFDVNPDDDFLDTAKYAPPEGVP